MHLRIYIPVEGEVTSDCPVCRAVLEFKDSEAFAQRFAGLTMMLSNRINRVELFGKEICVKNPHFMHLVSTKELRNLYEAAIFGLENNYELQLYLQFIGTFPSLSRFIIHWSK